MSLTSLAKSVRKITSAAVGTKQPALAGLMAEWREVVGSEWAQRCVPADWKVARGGGPATLELAVSAGTAPLVAHELPILEARINAYFGHKAVGAVRLKQVESLPAPAVVKARVEPEPLPVAVEDPELALALGRLGAAVSSRR